MALAQGHRDAELSYTNLTGAILTGADLYDANLYELKLDRADLTGADLTKADLGEAILHGTNLAAALGTTQGVHFIDTLDQHRPRLATARSGGFLTRWLVGYGGLRLLPHPTRLVRVPTVITNQVRALGRYVLCELGEKIQGREDLKVALHSRSYSISLRIGKGAASLLFGLVDDLPCVANLY